MESLTAVTVVRMIQRRLLLVNAVVVYPILTPIPTAPQTASTMTTTTTALLILSMHSRSIQASPLTMTAMELATTQIKTMTATARMMQRMVVHSMRTNPHQANVGAALQTPTPMAMALRIVLTIALRLRTQIKLTATAMASATLVKHSQATAMEMALLILAMCRLALLRTAIPTVNLMNVKMDPFGDRLVIWVVSGLRQAQKLQQALCSTCQRQSRM